ncbi:helix-turn-helix transcriptional regulator [uncultured Oscillibacter sp.]|nr:helix-turn-helix transcriptional regulator [uncultured Oscillibacter sp.]
MTPSTYSEYEGGTINIPIDILIKLADLYRVSPDYPMGRSDRP